MLLAFYSFRTAPGCLTAESKSGIGNGILFPFLIKHDITMNILPGIMVCIISLQKPVPFAQGYGKGQYRNIFRIKYHIISGFWRIISIIGDNILLATGECTQQEQDCKDMFMDDCLHSLFLKLNVVYHQRRFCSICL